MLSSRDAQIIDIWVENQPSSHTRYCYRHDSERLLKHVRKTLVRITLRDLQSFAQSLIAAGLAPISRVRTLAAVKSLFGFCHRMRYLPANPAAELALPSYENRLVERILGEVDMRRVLAAELKPRNRILLNLLYVAGLRVSEACRLRWRNLNGRGDVGQITVFGKNGRTRAIALPAGIWSELSTHRAKAAAEDLVFPSKSGRQLDRGQVCTIVRRAALRAGIMVGVSPHWMRHAHASHALDHGAPIHLVQATLGHSSVATTSRYLHARPGDSSARFLALETLPSESVARALLVPGLGVMNVLTGITPAKGERLKMNNATTETKDTVPVSDSGNAPRKANAGAKRPCVAPIKGKATKKPAPAKKVNAAPKPAQSGKSAGNAREGSKTARVLDLLKRPGGVTAKELMKATGWQPHSVRGFLSGTVGKKMGLAVSSTKGEDGERSYSIKG